MYIHQKGFMIIGKPYQVLGQIKKLQKKYRTVQQLLNKNINK